MLLWAVTSTLLSRRQRIKLSRRLMGQSLSSFGQLPLCQQLPVPRSSMKARSTRLPQKYAVYWLTKKKKKCLFDLKEFQSTEESEADDFNPWLSAGSPRQNIDSCRNMVIPHHDLHSKGPVILHSSLHMYLLKLHTESSCYGALGDTGFTGEPVQE